MSERHEIDQLWRALGVNPQDEKAARLEALVTLKTLEAVRVDLTRAVKTMEGLRAKAAQTGMRLV